MCWAWYELGHLDSRLRLGHLNTCRLNLGDLRDLDRTPSWVSLECSQVPLDASTHPWWSGEHSRSDSNSTTKIPNAEIPEDCSWTAGIVGNLPWIPLSQVTMTACPLTFTMQAMLSPQKLPLLLPQMDTFWSPGPWSLLTIWAGSSSCSPF